MIGHYVTVAVLLTYLHSINAQIAYITDPAKLKAALLEEINHIAQFYGSFDDPASRYPDNACDLTDKEQKQYLCDKIMEYMINDGNDEWFEKFVGWAPDFPQPTLINSRRDHYKCEKTLVETYNTEKRMFWCAAKKYTTKSGLTDTMPGFFCAGHPMYRFKAYAFRAPVLNGRSVKPVAEILNINYFARPKQ